MKTQVSCTGNACISRYILLTVVFVLFSFSALLAQEKFYVTFRPDGNFPSGNFGTATLKSGCGFEVTGNWQFSKHLSAYGGWGMNFFGDKESSDQAKIRYEETGYTIGLHYFTPLCKDSKMNLLLGAGGVYAHAETTGNDGTLLYDTGHRPGWLLEAGLSFPLGARWWMIPTARYHAVTYDNMPGSSGSSATLDYFDIGVGVSWILWEKK